MQVFAPTWNVHPPNQHDRGLQYITMHLLQGAATMLAPPAVGWRGATPPGEEIFREIFVFY
jgi:hypothetical protein